MNASERVVLAAGTVIDGLGGPGWTADVVVQDGRIAAIRPQGAPHECLVIDCAGKVVAPGFVDIHSHADFTIMVDPRAHSALLQGVTTIVPGNCGLGVAPLSDEHRSDAPMNISGWRARDDGVATWRSFGEYLDVLRERRPAVNVVPLVAHGAARVAISGFDARPLTRTELATLVAHVDEALRAGAAGLSTGLEYLPGRLVPPEELRLLCARVGAHGGLYATHCRDRGEGIVHAVAEAVALATQTGCRLQLSHLVRRPGRGSRSLADRALALVEEAHPAVNALSDVFPFDHGPTPLSFVLPAWARDGSRACVASLLAAARTVERVLDDFNPRFVLMLAAGVADEMYVVNDGGDGELEGRSIGRIARAWGIDTGAAVVRILARAGEDIGDVTIVERWADWEDLAAALRHPSYAIMGDGVTTALGDRPGTAFHLSDWGWAPAMLGDVVRDRGLVVLEEAVRRMTSLPADQLGLAGRGRLAEGAAADITVFDAATISTGVRPDRTTVVPEGIEHVLVNGVLAVRDRAVTGARAGVVGRG